MHVTLTPHRKTRPAACRQLALLEKMVVEHALDHDEDATVPLLQRIASDPLTEEQAAALAELVDHFVDMARADARNASDDFFRLGVEAALRYPNSKRK